jgi:hypothetical protein
LRRHGVGTGIGHLWHRPLSSPHLAEGYKRQLVAPNFVCTDRGRCSPKMPPPLLPQAPPRPLCPHES